MVMTSGKSKIGTVGQHAGYPLSAQGFLLQNALLLWGGQF